MKKLVKVKKVQGKSLVGLMGEVVDIYCMNYIYSGVLVGVNDECVKLEKASIVYETGAFTDRNFKDAQALPHDLYIQKGTIESFSKSKTSK